MVNPAQTETNKMKIQIISFYGSEGNSVEYIVFRPYHGIRVYLGGWLKLFTAMPAWTGFYRVSC